MILRHISTVLVISAATILAIAFGCGGGDSSGADDKGVDNLPTPMVVVDTPTPLPTNSMSLTRGTHTATLLGDGRILIAGGDDASGRLDAITDTAEIFDPSTGRWDQAGAMSWQRTAHAAVALNDGRALLVGGAGVKQTDIQQQGQSLPLLEAETFDPSTDTWSLAGEISIPREGLAIAKLADGNILISGGDNGSGEDDSVVNTAEVFDAASGIWSLTASMSISRQGHSAVLLRNGAVLVSGGDDSEDALRSTEIYDPAGGAWQTADEMVNARERFTATVLEDGRVLAAGGSGGSGPQSSAEIYDPQTGAWSTTGELETARLKHAAVRLQDGRVLVIGGLGVGQFVAAAEIYDPSEGTWSAAGTLTTGRGFHTATLANDGTVIVVGGFGFSGPLNSTEIYDPDANSWSLANP